MLADFSINKCLCLTHEKEGILCVLVDSDTVGMATEADLL